MAFRREQAGIVQRPDISKKDRLMAWFCLHCPVCNRARKSQRRAAFWWVKRIETGVCPFSAGHMNVSTGARPTNRCRNDSQHHGPLTTKMAETQVGGTHSLGLHCRGMGCLAEVVPAPRANRQDSRCSGQVSNHQGYRQPRLRRLLPQLAPAPSTTSGRLGARPARIRRAQCSSGCRASRTGQVMVGMWFCPSRFHS